MDRNREGRRASIVGSNGFNRRRPRTSSHRDSPDEDGGVDFQESVRLRDRVKKDRDRDRERERERERDRERESERERERSSRSKRRRAERLMSNREDGGDDTSEESIDDDEVYEDEENITTTSSAAIGGGVRPPPTPASSLIPNHHHHSHHSNHHHSQSQQHNISGNNSISNNHHLQHRKSYPPAASSSSSKVFRVAPVWKAGDEMIGVSVPRKARSASTKRSHDWVSSSSNNNGGVAAGEQILRQASTSPARQGLASTSAPSPAPPQPMSPSSSNISNRKKLKLGSNNGQKLKPPKASSKSNSSNPEDLEIEIAEVLYGLRTQSQGPSSKKDDSREVNRSNLEAKSQVSSPISNSTMTSNPVLPPTSSPLSVVAPKRKRPRQVVENPNYGARSSPSSTDQKPKSETSSPTLDKIPGSTAAENGYDMGNLVNSQGVAPQPPEPVLPEAVKVGSESKPVAEELRESRDSPKEEVSSQEKKEYPAVRVEGNNPEDSSSTATAAVSVSVSSPGIKLDSTQSGSENPREPKFEIDLMAPPPQVRSSTETDAKVELRAADQKPVVSGGDAVVDKEDEKVKVRKDDSTNVGDEDKKGKGTGTAEEDKPIDIKARNIDLQLDLEKPERDGNAVNKLHQQLPTKSTREDQQPEKSGQSTSSLALPVSMANWPGELPQMGYMAPLQGIVSMDGSAVTPAPIQPLFTQPRPKRCATHVYIAQNIHYLQQFAKMHPFWHGSASLFGSKPCNLNVVPSADLLGNVAVRGVNNAPDKRQSLANIPTHSGKEKSSQPSSTSDSAQRKQQILLQQALPPVAPNNLMGPAFIFPLNQQQPAVAVASARPATGKPPTSTGGGGIALSNPANSAAANASASATVGGGPAMSFNYPNMPPGETPYLAILQNNAYPFPMPAMGGPTNYRGPPSQAMPLFNGSFYSSQIIHPSQIQLQQPPGSLTHQMQAHQNPTSSSSSQKHLQSQQSRPQGGGGGGGGGSGNGNGVENLQNFATQRAQTSQLPQHTQSHHMNPGRGRHLENDLCGEDSPSTADSRGARTSMNIYGQNFPVPIHAQNFALMTPSAALTGGAASQSVNQSEKKQQPSQQQGLKSSGGGGVESQSPHTFPMSFGLINGTTTGPVIDMSSMSQNHAIFQSFPEATRQNIQMMAAAAAAQKKNFRISDDGKSGGGDSSAADDERKASAGKSEGGVGRSIVFTRTDLADPAVSSHSLRPVSSNNVGSINQNAQMPAQLHPQQAQQLRHRHQQQMLQLQKQQQQLPSTFGGGRSKAPATSTVNIYSDHLNSSSSTVAKFPNALSEYPQNLVQNSNVNSPNQSPQWKSSVRTSTSQAPSSLVSSTTSSMKNHSQQQSRSQHTQQTHTQISFGGNQKPSSASQVQPPSSGNQVTSPTTSSISKGPSGSPRNTGPSTSSKTGQASSLSAQSAKNSQPVPSQKSPSILGNPHVISSSNSGTKPQMQQQSSQQPKNVQQTQLFFSHPYSQAQSPHSTSMSSTTSGNSGYYMQRRRPQQQSPHPPGAQASSSTAMLSLCQPVTLTSTSTNDPAKAIAAATCNVKGGGLQGQGLIHAAQFAAQPPGNLLPGFSYVHTVAAAVPVKPAEQKQPTGNDNLHPWQPEKK